jgi:uncharacterized protein YdcH (DUF465 family)
MHIEPHDLDREFPELADTLHTLDVKNPRFHSMFKEYQDLDAQIIRAEEDVEPMADEFLEPLKVRRVHLKDQLYDMLNQAPKRV